MMENNWEGRVAIPGKGLLLVISGPSGAGKGTLCKALRAEMPELVYSVSATTRLPRPGEVHGVDYFFVSREEFARAVEEEGFLEWAEVYGNWYGTPRRWVEEMIGSGRDVVLEIDIQGARQVKKRFPKGVFIFVVPPTMEELARRLTGRGTDSPEEIARRLSQAVEEMECAHEYDYVVVNDKVEKAVATLKSIIEAERCRIRDTDDD